MNQKLTLTNEDDKQYQLNLSVTIDSDQSEIDLRIYGAILKKYKWIIFWITLFAVMISTLASLSLTPIYQATTTLLIETQPINTVAIKEVYDQQSTNLDAYQAHIHMLQSRVIADHVINQLDLETYPEFKPNPSRIPHWPDWLQALLPQKKQSSPIQQQNLSTEYAHQVFQQHLSVNQIGNSALLAISFESSDRKLAPLVANKIAEVYIQHDLTSRMSMTKNVASWLMERIDSLRINLENSEKALQNYMEQYKLVDVQGVTSILAEQLRDVSQNLEKMRKQQQEAANIFNQIQSVKDREVLPLVFNHPLVQRAKEIEAQQRLKISELRKRYGNQHPKMIAATNELQVAHKNTRKYISQVIDSFNKKYDTAKSNVRSLQQRKKQLEAQIQKTNQKIYQLRILKRDVETNRQLHDMFLARFKETDVSQTQQSSVGRVTDPAVPPVHPIKPRKKLIIIFSTIMSALMAIILAFLFAYLDNTLKSKADVEQRLSVPMLGILPTEKISSKQARHSKQGLWSQQKCPFAEAIRTIRTGIMLSSITNQQTIIVISSSVQAEGKTTFALNQAFALGEIKKTLLIDADMRRPSTNKILELSTKMPGLTELVLGSHNLSECIYTTAELSFDLLPAGISLPPNPLELLSSQHFKDILIQLSQQYEAILLDAPPIGIVSDALVLASYTSSVIYIVKADCTPYQLAKEGISQFQQAKNSVLGVVLNQLDMQKHKQYNGLYEYYAQDET